MTEAPERIWTPKNGQSIIPGGVHRWPSDVQYTRADVSDALVAAAREEALREALQRITDLKRGHSEDVDEGHEQAYRAIETLITKNAE